MKEVITERLIIRKFTSEDWRGLYEYLSDPKVVKYEPYEIFTEEECKKEAIKRSNNEAFWAVCLKENNKLIGNIYLEEQDFQTWELGYVFNASYHRQGYATESAKGMMDNAFRSRSARRIIAMCNPENEASWRLMERLSMRREGHLKKNIYFKSDEDNNPIWQDTYEYAILLEEWH